MDKKLLLLLGITLITQATTSLVGGIVGIGPFTDTSNMATALIDVSGNIGGIYAGIFLQIITSVVIVALGAALYQAGKHINKTAGIIALGLYIVEAITHIIGQLPVFAITEASKLFAENGDAALLSNAQLLFSAREFIGAITMIPFGFGAIIFYLLILIAGIIPKWLGLWGLITVPLVLVGWTFEAFSVISVPFILYVPYIPWEWVAGVYILAMSSKTPQEKQLSRT